MENTNELPFYLVALREAYLSKKAKNPRYSLRSYAQFLEVNAGTLSAILSQKRSPSAEMVQPFLKKLKLPEKDQKKFLDSMPNQRIAAIQGSHELEAERYHAIYEDWEYFVILALFRLQDFQSSAAWMAQKTLIPLERVEECVKNLFAWGLLQEGANGMWERVHSSVRSSHNISSEVIRASHRSSLKLALSKIDTVPVENRDYSFVTVGLDRKRFTKLKKLILKFRDEVFELDEASRRKALYRVSVQCFPLTEVE